MVREYTEHLIHQGEVVFSPIVYSHPMAKRHDGKAPPQGWINFDLEILKRCDEMIVFCIPGWKESIGVNEEIYLCAEKDIPVRYVYRAEMGDYHEYLEMEPE